VRTGLAFSAVVDAAAGGLVGREVELALVRAAVAELGEGHGGLVWIDGEPGVGKSLLIEAGLAEAADRRVRIFRAVGDELTPALALGFLADGLLSGEADSFRSEIADLLSGRGGGLDAVLAAAERMVALVERECATSPVALVSDDLQWADEASLAAWHHLARISEQAPLLLIAAARRVPRRDTVERLRSAVHRHPGAVLVELGPLDEAAVAEIAAAKLGASAGPRLRAGLARAGGNPLYVGEMIDAIIREGLVQVVDGVAETLPQTGLETMSLNAAITRRLGFLSSRARPVLRAGAVLGARFTVAELATMSGQAVPDLTAIVDEALLAGVLADTGADLMFRHPLIRQALHDEVPAALRSGLHGHAARELAQANASWDRVARHLLAAPDAIDGWVLEWLARVPPASLSALPGVAAELLDQARRVTLPGDPRRGLFTAWLTTSLRLLRRPDELVEVGTEALTTVVEPRFIGEIGWNLARGYQMLPGRGAEGLTMIDGLLAGPDPGVPWRGRLRAQKAILLATSGFAAESIIEANAAIEDSEHGRDPIAGGWALVALLQGVSGTEALEVVDRALALVVGDDPESTDLRLLFLANRLVVLSNLNRAAEFEAALTRTIAVAEMVGTTRLVLIQIGAIDHFRKRGDWDQALLYAGLMRALTPYEALGKHGPAALIHAHRGEFVAAAEQVSAVADVSYTAKIDFMLVGENLILARALIAEAEGDLRRAIDFVSVWLDPKIERSAHWRAERASALTHLVRFALAAGDRRVARAAADASASDGHANDDPELMVVAALCAGMIDDDVDPILAAADHFESIGRPLEVGFAAEEAAVRLAASGDTLASRQAFERAMRWYEQLGAVTDLRRVQARLRPFGIRGGSRSPHRHARVGWEALTATEQRVAAFVAEGWSNPEIASRMYVSRRTVEAHVAHILRKLQVNSRIEVRIEAGRQNATTVVSVHL
jgi:DNA-binding CsgD family transcriptional regulator